VAHPHDQNPDRLPCACGKPALIFNRQCLDCWRRDHTHACTQADPWREGKYPPGDKVEHPDAESIGDRDFGGGEYCERYRCPHCGHTFYVELPQ
jgi:hypothetical protein